MLISPLIDDCKVYTKICGKFILPLCCNLCVSFTAINWLDSSPEVCWEDLVGVGAGRERHGDGRKEGIYIWWDFDVKQRGNHRWWLITVGLLPTTYRWIFKEKTNMAPMGTAFSNLNALQGLRIISCVIVADDIHIYTHIHHFSFRNLTIPKLELLNTYINLNISITEEAFISWNGFKKIVHFLLM